MKNNEIDEIIDDDEDVSDLSPEDREVWEQIVMGYTYYSDYDKAQKAWYGTVMDMDTRNEFIIACRNYQEYYVRVGDPFTPVTISPSLSYFRTAYGHIKRKRNRKKDYPNITSFNKRELKIIKAHSKRALLQVYLYSIHMQRLYNHKLKVSKWVLPISNDPIIVLFWQLGEILNEVFDRQFSFEFIQTYFSNKLYIYFFKCLELKKYLNSKKIISSLYLFNVKAFTFSYLKLMLICNFSTLISIYNNLLTQIDFLISLIN